jgi:HAAS domain-containing protein
MNEHDVIDNFIERIIAGAHIPSRAQRDDLRRELRSHFEEAGTSSEAIRNAIEHFGSETLVTESLQRVYRWDYLFLYFAKVAASIVASSAVALLIQVAVNLRVELKAEVLRLAPGFSNAAGVSVAVVLALVTAWEVGRPPFNRSRAVLALSAYLVVCAVVQMLFAKSAGAFITGTILVVLGYLCSQLEPRPARLLLIFAVFAIELYGAHLMISVTFGPGRALLSSAVLVAVWISTVFILARMDHLFVNLFDNPKDNIHGNGTQEA